MKYQLLKDLMPLIEQFDEENKLAKDKIVSKDLKCNPLEGFKTWLFSRNANGVTTQTGMDINKVETVDTDLESIVWEGKDAGRSPESVINTLIVHMNRYAKTYSKSAMVGSDFSSQEDFIYLIILKSFGSLTKMELIRKNKHDKPVGMQIINRLIKQGWAAQRESDSDKRSKVIEITPHGLEALEKQMGRIRQATEIVTGNLNRDEKLQLIKLLYKLDVYHQEIYDQQIDSEKLLDQVMKTRQQN
ncbi:MAG: MarR family transcriptional regulator [Pedobacter sp.]|nr:MAG: MarR family transcriptional regulator [Pedobacter sp.]